MMAFRACVAATAAAARDRCGEPAAVAGRTEWLRPALPTFIRPSEHVAMQSLADRNQGLHLCVRSSDAAHSRSLGRAVEAAHQLSVLLTPVLGKLTLQLLPGLDQRLLL